MPDQPAAAIPTPLARRFGARATAANCQLLRGSWPSRVLTSRRAGQTVCTMYSISYFVTTPLVSQTRCDSRAQVAQLIHEYIDGKSDASLNRVNIVEVLGTQSVEDGIERDPALFLP